MKSIELIKKMIFDSVNDSWGDFKCEESNKEYESFTFVFNGVTFRHRLAKKTPHKDGYFVVMWKKDELGTNRPYSLDECSDVVVITIIDGSNKGQFFLRKGVLVENGILSHGVVKGKMGFRVYPSWECDLNLQAKKTQKWQIQHFFDLSFEDQRNGLISLYSNDPIQETSAQKTV